MATILALPDRDTPRGRVAAEVRAELGRAKVSTNRLPRLIGKSQSYWWRRVSGDLPFDTDDLQALADLLNVHPAKFLGVDVSAPTRDPDPWAPRGSNPQPTDYKSAAVSNVRYLHRVPGPRLDGPLSPAA